MAFSNLLRAISKHPSISQLYPWGCAASGDISQYLETEPGASLRNLEVKCHDFSKTGSPLERLLTAFAWSPPADAGLSYHKESSGFAVPSSTNCETPCRMEDLSCAGHVHLARSNLG